MSWIICCQVVLFSVPSAVPQPDERGPRYNVVLIVSDDLNTDLGCYGNKDVHTPNLDALARRGVRFSHAFVQYPLCNPSRASFLSGRTPCAINVSNQEQIVRETFYGLVTLPECFKRNGYITARVGKVFHDNLDDSESWTEVIKSTPLTMKNRSPRSENDLVGAEGKPADAAEGARHIFQDEKVRESGIEFMKRNKDRPFFLALGFRKPHTPYVATTEEFARYKNAEVPSPIDFAGKPTPRPGVPVAAFRPNSFPFDSPDMKLQDAIRLIKLFRACVTNMDENIGEVMAGLRDAGVEDKTIVIFASDNGVMLGKDGCWGKYMLNDDSTRVPLIIVPPKRLWKAWADQGKSPKDKTVDEAAIVCSRTVELLDIYPSLVEMCGIKNAPALDGKSLVSLILNPTQERRRGAYSVCKGFSGRSIRFERYRYTEWELGKKGIELYDYASDPDERINQASNPKYREALDNCKKALAERVREEYASMTGWRYQSTNGAKVKLERSQNDKDRLSIVPILTAKEKHPYDAAVRYLADGIKEGESYFVQVKLRSDTPREVDIAVTDFAPPFQSLGVYRALKVTPNWKTHLTTFKANKTLPATAIQLLVGKDSAKFEVRDILVDHERWTLLAPDKSDIHWGKTDPALHSDRLEYESLEEKGLWKVRMRNVIKTPIVKDQQWEFKFRARADQPRKIVMAALQTHKPWTNLGIYQTVELTKEWKTYSYSFAATGNESDWNFDALVGDSLTPFEIADFKIEPKQSDAKESKSLAEKPPDPSL